MRGLPEGWILTSLGEVGQWGSGGTPSRKNHEYFGSGIPWIKSGDLPDGSILRTEEQITELGLKNSSAKLMPAGTISIAMYGATIGKLGLLTFPAATNQACANVIPHSQLIDRDYLFFYLLSERQALIDKGQGGAQPNISQEVIKAHPIVIAPLAEQRRIVAKLEPLLGSVNTYQQRFVKIPVILKRFRQAVLAAACSGQLTENWRRSDGDACVAWRDSVPKQPVEIPNGYTRLGKQAFKLVKIEHSARDLPSTWSLVTIGELYRQGVLIDFADGNHGSLYPRKEDFGQSGALFLTATQIGENWELSLQECPRLAHEKAQQLTKGWSRNSDVLLTHNATVGRIAMLEGLTEEVLLGTSVTFYRFNENFILPRFVRILFSSPFFQEQLQAEMEQTTRNQVPITKQVSLNFICPPIEEQREIVRHVETLFKLADQIEAHYQKAKPLMDKLPQSILAKAFRGELVPTEAELARREGRDYEPASVLLECIRSERAEHVKGRKEKARLQPKPSRTRKRGGSGISPETT